MPVKKYATAEYSVMPKAIDIMNVIRNDASQQYQDRIPIATQNNIAEVGNPILQYQATANEFLSALVNRISLVLITNKSYNNPLKQFKRGELTLGETVEEIFVNIIKSEPYYREDTEGKTVCEDEFAQRIPDVRAVFHKRNRRGKYPVTISNDDLRTAFVSWGGVEDLVSKIITAVYTSDEYDEFLLMKNIFFEAGRRGALYPITIPDPTNKETSEDGIITLRKTAADLTLMSDKFNYMGVTTHTAIEDQVIFINTMFNAVTDVKVLAAAFNMDKTDFLGRRILVDDFGGLEKLGVVAIVVDRDWFMAFDNFISFTETYVASRLYWNYFLHHWATYSYSPFKNAIAYTTQAPVITTVTVTPGTASVTGANGGSVTLSAAVDGTGLISPRVTWTVTGAEGVTVDREGVVTVPKGTAAGTATVTATSIMDETKTGTATITIA